jgi:hypothetical protein
VVTPFRGRHSQSTERTLANRLGHERVFGLSQGIEPRDQAKAGVIVAHNLRRSAYLMFNVIICAPETS